MTLHRVTFDNGSINTNGSGVFLFTIQAPESFPYYVGSSVYSPSGDIRVTGVTVGGPDAWTGVRTLSLTGISSQVSTTIEILAYLVYSDEPAEREDYNGSVVQ